MRFRVGATTDVGRVREGNEDSYMVQDPLFAVADGMGGHQGGEVASSLALETLKQVNEEPESELAGVVQKANRVVFRKASEDPGLAGMGTTLTAVLGDGEVLRLAHVGDSRAYLLRDGEMKRITKDHTIVERLVEEGRITPREAEIHPQRSILTRALGVDEDIQVDEATLEVRLGDRLLLCSDGLTGMVSEEDIQRVLTEAEDPQTASERLVDAANEAGGQDNITAVVIDVLEPNAKTDTKASSRAVDEGFAAPASVRSGRLRRVVLWVVLPAILIGGALWTIKTYYIDRQWFVGESNGHVALFNGIPAEPLGLELSTLVEETQIPASEISSLREYQTLGDGITAESEQDARDIITQMQEDLQALEPQPQGAQ
ncbi:MAG: Stp1/IreP family PP2C-type Ser/Thr phosphatase [Actinomycetota bacterium]